MRRNVDVSVQAVILAGVVGLGACSSEPRGTVPTHYVDGASVGGACSDARTAAQNTLTTPWCSLAVAFARAPSGSAVRVRRGTYPRVVLPYYAPARRVTFSGYGDERPNVAGVTIGSATAPVLTRNLSMQHLRFTGSVNVAKFDSIDISHDEFALTPAAPTNCSSTTRSCDVHTPNGLTATAPGSHLTFRGNYVHDGNHALSTRQPGAPSTFTDFTVSGNRFVHMGGVVMHIDYGARWVVQGNEFADNGRFANIDPYVHPDAVHVIGADDDILFDGNYVHSVVGGRGILLEPAAPGVLQTHMVVRNNVVVGTTTDFALRVAGGGAGLRVINNTFWLGQPVPGTGLHLESTTAPTTGVVAKNNLLNHLESDGATFAAEDYNLVGVRRTGPGYTTPPPGPHDLAGTPRFRNLKAPAWDAHLLAGSPGRDAGDASVMPPIDAAGIQRSAPPDLGAFEQR